MSSIFEDCSICIEPFNNFTRKEITCSHCDLKCCTLCTKKYLENSSVSPQCMSCHTPWSHQHIRENFGPSFVKKLSELHKNVLYTEQLTLIPYTQGYVNLQEKHESLKKKDKEFGDELVAKMKERNDLFNTMYTDNTSKKRRRCKNINNIINNLMRNKDLQDRGMLPVPLTEDEEKLLDLTEEYKNLEIEKYSNNVEKSSVIRRMLRISQPERFSRNSNNITFIESSSSSVKSYIKPCGKDNCKGYVNKGDNKCELCKTIYCSKCMEEKCDNHECKEEDIQTVKFLRKDTKNCPSCATMIYRISGCPDMFCVNCNTAFNWNTLEINKRGNSNPHYYEWLRRSGGGGNSRSRDQNADCGRELYTYDMMRSSTYRNLTRNQQEIINTILIRFHHFENRYNVNSYFKDFQKTRSHDFHIITLSSRADYMRHKITEKTFKQLLLRSHKAKEYNNNINEILSSIREFRQCLLRNIVYFDSENNTFNFDSFVLEATNFVKYINECVVHLDLVFYNKKKSKDFMQIVW